MTSTRTLIGFHAVMSRLRQHAESVESVYVDATRQDARMRDLAARANTARVTVHAVDAARFATLAGNAPHQGVVAIVDAERPHVTVDDVLSDLAEPALLLVLDGVTDPHNLGACLRNADAFGAQAVIVPKDRAVGLNATAAKAASGAAETVPVITVTNLSRALADLGLHRGADGEELGDVRAPLLQLDRQPHRDDAVRAEHVGLGLHPGHRQLPGVVHRLGQHVHLLVLAPPADLQADVVDGGAEHQPEWSEAGVRSSRNSFTVRSEV